ncbi:hypothetical protein RHGRI_025768 [Rhododendron griersonianum]|uniref:Disease resistance N-terminal domain-containing protein n=1 Tax=Rhododendron griersonianum TaxID=479676 RepID=A0AAV6IR69_9ERIC|nr:hypothetical protein RHGRI_025768 [Rhododendron griersonianum]
MAMIAVVVVVEKLATLLAEEAQFLGGVRRGVSELRDDLESMRSFLQDAESRTETEKGVETWVKQVRDVAYDTEDILDEYSFRLSLLSRQGRPNVQVVVEKLATLLAEEAQFLGGVRRGVTELRDDLESMRSFLQDAESRIETEKSVETWVKQVRDVAHDTEDILDEFSLRLSLPYQPGRLNGLTQAE